MVRHPHDPKTSSPAVRAARDREAQRERLLRGGTTGRVVRDGTKSSGWNVDLTIPLEEIPDTGVDVTERLPATFIDELLDDGREPRWRGRDDATIELHLSRESTLVRLEGSISFRLLHPCVRCLNDVPFDVDLDVRLRLVERSITDVVEGDLAAGILEDGMTDSLGDADGVEDLDVASFQGGAISITAVLREQHFLELPPHPACDHPLARPTEPCVLDAAGVLAAEQGRGVDPRWAGLAQLRDRLPPGPPQVPEGVDEVDEDAVLELDSDDVMGDPLEAEDGSIPSDPRVHNGFEAMVELSDIDDDVEEGGDEEGDPERGDADDEGTSTAIVLPLERVKRPQGSTRASEKPSAPRAKTAGKGSQAAKKAASANATTATKPAPKKAAPQKAAPQKATKASPKKASPKKASPKKAAPQKAASKKAASKKAASKKAASKKAASKKGVPKKAAAKKAVAKKAAGKKATSKKAPAKRASPATARR